MSTDLRAAAPLVSVVIPTFNRAEYIAETLESVLTQSYPNLEIFVVDDGSTDNTREVVAPYETTVRYVWQENRERGASRNHGLRLASGEYIAFLDSDDLWLPTKVEEDVRFLQAHPDVGLVYTDSIQVDARGKELRRLRVDGPSGRVTATLLQRTLVSIGTHLMCTSLVREIGGFREERQLAGAEDWEFWVRLSLITEFAYNPVATTKIRIHPANTMGNPTAMERCLARAAELFEVNETLTACFGRSLPPMKARTALINAVNYCTTGDTAKTAAYLRDAISADPRVIFDRRYGYTILRLLRRRLGSGRSRRH